MEYTIEKTRNYEDMRFTKLTHYRVTLESFYSSLRCFEKRFYGISVSQMTMDMLISWLPWHLVAANKEAIEQRVSNG